MQTDIDPDIGFKTLRAYERWKESRLLETAAAMAEIQADVDRREAEFNAKRLAAKPGQMTKASEDHPGKTLLLFFFYEGWTTWYLWAFDEDDARRCLWENCWDDGRSMHAGTEPPSAWLLKFSRK